MNKTLSTILDKVNTINKIEESIIARIIDIPLECKPDGDKSIKELSVLSNQKNIVDKLESEIKLLISVLETDEDIKYANNEFDNAITRYNETLHERTANINNYYRDVERNKVNNNIEKVKNNDGFEKTIGLKVSNIIGAILILIGVLWFSTVAYMLFGNTMRSILTTLIGIGFTIPGYHMYNKNRKNVFGIGILGCGISILYASVLMGCVAYEVYSEIMMLLLMIVLTAIMNSIYLKFKSEWLNVFMIIGCYLPCCSRLIFDDSMVIVMGFYLIIACLMTTLIGSRGKYGIALCLGAFLNFIATLAFLSNSGDFEVLQLFLVGITSIIYIYMSSVHPMMKENVGGVQRAIVTVGYTLFSVIAFCCIAPYLTEFNRELTVTYLGNVIEILVILAYCAVLYFVSHLIKVSANNLESDAESAISKAAYIIMRIVILSAVMLCTNLINHDDELAFILMGGLSLLYLMYAEYSKKIEFNLAGLFGWAIISFCTLMQVGEWMSALSNKVGWLVYEYAHMIYGEKEVFAFGKLDVACLIGVVITAFLINSWRNKNDFRAKACKFLIFQPILTVLILILGVFNTVFVECTGAELLLLATVLTPIMYCVYKCSLKIFPKDDILDKILDGVAGLALFVLNMNMVYMINRFAGSDSYEPLKVLLQSVAFATSVLYSIIIYINIYRDKDYVTEFKVISKIVITLFTVCMACGLYDFTFTEIWVSLILIVISCMWLVLGFKRDIKIQRVCSLILLMASTVKLCIVDVIVHEPGLIIITCFACGLSLFGLSFMYQQLEKKHISNE